MQPSGCIAPGLGFAELTRIGIIEISADVPAAFHGRKRSSKPPKGLGVQEGSGEADFLLKYINHNI